jgi:hypothetical protein
MRTIKTKGRPLRRHPLPDTEPSTDRVFLRLIQDLHTARRAQRQIKRGELPQSQRDAAESLERGAFHHLFNYLNAHAWVRSNDRDA